MIGFAVTIALSSAFGGFAVGYALCQLTSVAGWERRFNRAMKGWDDALAALARRDTTTHSAKEEGV